MFGAKSVVTNFRGVTPGGTECDIMMDMLSFIVLGYVVGDLGQECTTAFKARS